jgi:hypothetical protein
LQCSYLWGYVTVKTIVDSSIADAEMNKPNWFYNVKCMLARYGFLETWSNFCNINIANFISTFKQRLIDEFVQHCKGVMYGRGYPPVHALCFITLKHVIHFLL